MRQEQAQQAARHEKLVPTKDRVKIGKNNLRMDPTLTQKEETYQVMLDIIKKTPCYNAFLTSADVPIIYMQQFWFTIKSIKLTIGGQRSEDERSCPIPVDDDSVLDRLEFINKGEEYQVYGKPIPSGDWTNWKMTRHHGTVAAVEGSVRGSEKSVQGSEKKSILEADVTQCDW
nr:hypothetical protein [Tanacetum cinerariifolium]